MTETNLERYFDTPQAKMYIYNSKSNEIIRYTLEGEENKFPFNMGIVGYALEHKVKLNVLNCLNDNRYNEYVDLKTEMPVFC